MAQGPELPEGFDNLDEPGDAEEAGGDKAGSFFCRTMSNLNFEPLEEKELNQFIASVLNKTSKLHQLIGEIQSKYNDSRATRRVTHVNVRVNVHVYLDFM